MKSIVKLSALSGVLLCLAGPAFSEDAGSTSAELAFMPSAMDVTLLNEKGKFVTVDMKTLKKGEKCHMEKDAVIMKVGPGGAADTTRVRYIAPNFSHGGCPFMTEFEISNADYKAARDAFTARKAEASEKIDALKKQLGDKWNELTNDKPSPDTSPAQTK
ncbi:hypothetical protein [Hyphomicrobium sp.]|uniref:hypothetical protein n=1 Tax=Hyphomicrobium sp. TaxID=82 RepID=UPI002C582D6C|nr:hypothetical protein [Hyphomicrobium sp.]HVZ03138.1 hypothetical protein [Hyphomicrobium sp.]